MRKVPKPIRIFHVRPEAGSRLSVAIEIYRTAGEMRLTVKDENRRHGFKRSRTRGLVGETVGVTVYRNRTGRPRRTLPLFAIVRFPKEHLTMSTITHEAFHATMRWAERKRIQSIPTGGDRQSNITSPRYVATVEEQCATVHDTLCRKIVVQLRRFKLVD